MKIEVGKYYRTRDGRKVGPVIVGYSDFYQSKAFFAGGVSYKDNGMQHEFELPDDLIAEWTDTPEVGTLKEIGAQHMDLVEIVGSWNGQSVAKGSQWHIWRIDGDNYYGWQAQYPAEHKGTKLSGSSQWRIISRAPSGPVREVTRKEIMPGVYGRVAITGYDECGMVQIKLTQNEDGHYLTTWFNTDELTAAIETLTQIRDAMRDQ